MNTFKVPKVLIQNLYPAKLSFICEGQLKAFSDTEMWKEPADPYQMKRSSGRSKKKKKKKSDTEWKYRSRPRITGQMPTGSRQDDTGGREWRRHGASRGGSCYLARATVLMCYQVLQK